MFSLKVFLILSALFAASCGKWISVKNAHYVDLVVTADETDYTIATNSSVSIDLEDEWSGSISAIPVGAEVLNGPRTTLELSLSAAGDIYYVSLLNGFNLPAKIIPKGDTNCTSSVCGANILNVCSLASAVTNSNSTVVACENSPVVMRALCPLAVVDTLTATINAQSCTTATSYLLIFI